jgi:hypothetical protein
VLPVPTDVTQKTDDLRASRDPGFEGPQDSLEQLLRRRSWADDREALTILRTLDVDTTRFENGENAPGFISIADHNAVIGTPKPGFHETDGLGELLLGLPKERDVGVERDAPAGDSERDRRHCR